MQIEKSKRLFWLRGNLDTSVAVRWRFCLLSHSICGLVFGRPGLALRTALVLPHK